MGTLSDEILNTNLVVDTISTNAVPMGGGAIFMNFQESKVALTLIILCAVFTRWGVPDSARLFLDSCSHLVSISDAVLLTNGTNALRKCRF